MTVWTFTCLTLKRSCETERADITLILCSFEAKHLAQDHKAPSDRVSTTTQLTAPSLWLSLLRAQHKIINQTLSLSQHTGFEHFRVKGWKSGWRKEVGHEMYLKFSLPAAHVPADLPGWLAGPGCLCQQWSKKVGFSANACGFLPIRNSTVRSFSHSLAWGIRRDLAHHSLGLPEAQEGR